MEEIIVLSQVKTVQCGRRKEYGDPRLRRAISSPKSFIISPLSTKHSAWDTTKPRTATVDESLCLVQVSGHLS